MIDPWTTLGTGLTVLASKDLLNKVLGPSAEYLGDELLQWVKKKSHVNLDRVFKNALRMLGNRADEPGGVNLRILKHIIEEGRFCDDSLTAEYLGGVLASSKGEASRDDRGVFYLSEINGLSAYQLRSHYLIYAAMTYSGPPYNQDLSPWFVRHGMSVVIAESDYIAGMEYSGSECHEDIAYHALLGLEAVIDLNLS